jgi:hypothetical protein
MHGARAFTVKALLFGFMAACSPHAAVEDQSANVTAPNPSATTQHYVYFASDRERISEKWFLESKNIVGAQLKYAWRELEDPQDVYHVDVIEKDLEVLAAAQKKLFVQIQDASFSKSHNVPDYLRTDPKYHGGDTIQYSNETDEVPHGFMARRWDPAVQERFHLLLKALGAKLNGRIAGINLSESAIQVTSGTKQDVMHPTDPGVVPFNADTYLDGIKGNIDALKAAFTSSDSTNTNSVTLQYANFMPEAPDDNGAHSHLAALIAHADEIGVGVGGPDTKVGNRNQISYPMIAKEAGKIPTGLAVQDGNCSIINKNTGKQVTVPEVKAFGEAMGLTYMFWGLEEPFLDQIVGILEGVPPEQAP